MPNAFLWERRENETSKAFAAFIAYRDQEPLTRSIPQAAKDSGRKPQQFTRWSIKHDWVERAGAYDDFIDDHRRSKNLDIIDEMADRQAEAAMEMQNIAIESLKRIAEDMEVNPTLRLKEGNIMHYLTQGATLERVARGEPTAISETTTGPIEVLWKGPSLAGDDAPDAPGPVGSNPD